MAKYGAQYEGNDQHDAQEFLLWLLDKVHEDLNIASKEKYKKTKVRSKVLNYFLGNRNLLIVKHTNVFGVWQCCRPLNNFQSSQKI